MRRPSVEEIIQVMKDKGYKVYNTPEIEWNLNIVGIRAKSRIPDEFDDLLVVFHNFLEDWNVSYYRITTDPSPYYLMSPLNPDGTAILVPGQYESSFEIAQHRGRYNALCQNLGEVSVYRDNNNDKSLNMNANTIQTGFFGINIHRGPNNAIFIEDDKKYSAGCQVFADKRNFEEFMLKCKFGRESFSNKFTYTLLLERDFD